MSMSRTPSTAIAPVKGYSRFSRIKDAYRFIRSMAAQGPNALENTKSYHVARTYGVQQQLVKRIKARFRNELSFGSDK